MEENEIHPWKTLERKLILDHNRFLQVENHVVQLPDGQVIPDWAWVTIPDAVIVLARTVEKEFLCFRQTKYAVEGITLAPVGGMIEEGEPVLAAAQRELREETGYTATEWRYLGGYLLDPNRGVATMHLFLALNAQWAAEPIKDDLEDQVLLHLSQEELSVALMNGEFKIVSWTAVVSLALNALASQP